MAETRGVVFLGTLQALCSRNLRTPPVDSTLRLLCTTRKDAIRFI
jgi:hypothetical protein